MMIHTACMERRVHKEGCNNIAKYFNDQIIIFIALFSSPLSKLFNNIKKAGNGPGDEANQIAIMYVYT